MALPIGYTESEVLEKVQKEYNSSINATRDKRAIFERNMKLYLNTEDQDKKILSKYIWSTVQTLRSLHFVDDTIVDFSGRQLGDEVYANNLNKLAKFDYSEMKLPKKRMRVYEDKFLYGVGIEAFIGWDNVRQVPKSVVIDPMVRVPDMNPDDDYGARFHGFEYKSTKYQLTKSQGYNESKIQEYLNNQEAELLRKAQQEGTELRHINNQFSGDCDIHIYHHMTSFGRDKYHVTLTSDLSTVIRCIQILPSNKAEKEAPELIQFPVITRHWISLRYDPFGVNIFDILADKQMAMQLFDNLSRIKAEHEALGDLYLVDPDSIPDITILTQTKPGPKYIHATNLTQSPGVTPLIKGGTPSDVWNVRDRIQQNATLDIGMDERTLGVSPTGNMTATENQRVQANANLRIMLGMKEDTMSEKIFWTIWHNYYKLYFKKSSKKLFQLSNDLGNDTFELTKNDFITDNDIDVSITLKSELEAEREKKKVGFMALYGSILQDPETGKASKNFAKRMVLKFNGLSPEEIKRIHPYTAEEEQAYMDLELLNRNEEVGEVTDMSEDHLAYIMIYDQAKDTDAKQKAIRARKKAYVMSGQANKQGTSTMGGDNMQNMMVNQMMQKQPIQAESLPTMQANG